MDATSPPIWLEEKDPTMRLLDDMGLRHEHGGRRHCCSNNPTYQADIPLLLERAFYSASKLERGRSLY